MAQRIQKRPTSRWKNVGIVDDGVNVVQAREFRLPFKEKPDDTQYQIPSGKTILDIAADFYNGAWWLWWAIADRNKIDYWDELEPGTVIIIPSKQNIDLLIRARRKGIC